MADGLWFKVTHSGGQWRWRLYDQNGVERARSKIYGSRSTVLESIDAILEIEQAVVMDENSKLYRRGK